MENRIKIALKQPMTEKYFLVHINIILGLLKNKLLRI